MQRTYFLWKPTAAVLEEGESQPFTLASQDQRFAAEKAVMHCVILSSTDSCKELSLTAMPWTTTMGTKGALSVPLQQATHPLQARLACLGATLP